MKIDELINELKEVREEHGNLELPNKKLGRSIQSMIAFQKLSEIGKNLSKEDKEKLNEVL